MCVSGCPVWVQLLALDLLPPTAWIGGKSANF